MAENPDRDFAGAAPSDVGIIEKGWSVYDSLDRPVGNVTDVEGGKLGVDGRPQSLGFFEVALDTVKSAGDGEVHLSLEMESIPTPDATTHPRSTLDDEENPPIVGQSAAPDYRPTMVTDEAATASSGRGDALDGSSYTASGTPIGLGSNTPVGNEPDSFRTWDDEEPYRRSVWSRYGGWLGLAGLGLAGAIGMLWWQRRQARRRPIARVRDALGSAGESVERVREAIGSAGESVEPIWEAAAERKGAWGLALLAALPLLLWARSSREEEGPLDAVRDRLPETGDLKNRLSSLRLTERLESARMPTAMPDESAVLWWAGVPAVAGAVLAAWYAGRRGSAGKNRRLGEIMTSNVDVVRPDTTAFEAASTMKRLSIGALPVCDGRRLLGMVTDRDIVVRAVAEGRDPHLSSAQDVMTSELIYAREDDSVARGADLMQRHQIRRLPIVDRDQQLVGIVSLGDLAVDAGNDRLSGATLEQVSKPGR